MKRVYIPFLMLTLLTSVAGCGNNNGESSSKNTSDETSVNSGSEGESNSTPGTSETSEGKDSQTSSEPEDSEPDLPAIDYVKVFAESSSYSYVYAWIAKDSKTTELVGGWPGSKMEKYDDTWSTYDFKGYTAFNLIFSNNGAGQTGDYVLTMLVIIGGMVESLSPQNLVQAVVEMTHIHLQVIFHKVTTQKLTVLLKQQIYQLLRISLVQLLMPILVIEPTLEMKVSTS